MLTANNLKCQFVEIDSKEPKGTVVSTAPGRGHGGRRSTRPSR